MDKFTIVTVSFILLVLTIGPLNDYIFHEVVSLTRQNETSSDSMTSPHVHTTSIKEVNSLLTNAQRKAKSSSIDNRPCINSGTSYSIGEIIKTTKGWVKCTPTITVQGKNAEYGASVWVLTQELN